MKRIVEFRGFRIDVTRQIEKVRPSAEKAGVDLDAMNDVEALFYASKEEGVSIPELIGIAKN